MENIVDYTPFRQQVIDFLVPMGCKTISNEYNPDQRRVMIYCDDNLDDFIELMDGSIYFSRGVSSEIVTGVVALTNCVCYEHGGIRVGYKFVKGYDTIIKTSPLSGFKYCYNIYDEKQYIVTIMIGLDNSLELFTYNEEIEPILVRNCIRSIFNIKISIRGHKCRNGNMNIFDDLFDDNGDFYQSSDSFRPQYLD